MDFLKESVPNQVGDDTSSSTNPELNDFTIETVNPTRNDSLIDVDSDEARGETSASSNDSDSTNDPMITSTSYIERRIFT